MNLENFLTRSLLPQIDATSLYIKPNIPQGKLANAIREYAPEVGMSTVIVLLDESFWGNGKEGMLITNEKIILSKKLGDREFNLRLLNYINIIDKNLIVNDLPVTKFNKSEIMPLGVLGRKLNDFISTTKKTTTVEKKCLPLEDSTTEKLIKFLSRITEPLYFESVPAEKRKLGATTIGYVLGTDIAEEDEIFIRFKGGLSSSEVILSVSWLYINNTKDQFFCITNFGIYSVTANKPVVFLSHEDLKCLSPIEEYKESRHIGLRLSNDQGVIVSNQHAYIRPYAHELFSGLIKILNGAQPEDRINDNDLSKHQKQKSTNNSPNSLKQKAKAEKKIYQIPFNIINKDNYFDLIININTVDNVGDFISSIMSGPSNANSEIRKNFQSYIARSLKSFRKEIIDSGRFHQFKNDIATVEVCGGLMAYAFFQMLRRGVDEKLATRILFEGIRATFNIKSSAQSDSTGVILIKIVESYVSYETQDKLFMNFFLRLIGSNLSGKLQPDYFEILQPYADFLDDFIRSLEPGLSRFMNKIMSESSFLIDEVMGEKW